MNRQKGIKILTYFYLLPFGIMVLFNTFNSLLRTTYFDLYQYVEAARYRWDAPLFLIAISAGILAFFYLVRRRGWDKKSSNVKLATGFSWIICLVFLLLFRREVGCDSAALWDFSLEFM